MDGDSASASARDSYLERLGWALRGVSGDVADDLTREIESHIAEALAVRGSSDEAAMRDVLYRLGPPEEYVRDLALYMMVDRGYRQWSIPHMARSAAFWALSTVAGAVVVGAFAAMYLAGLVLVALGLAGLVDGALPDVPPLATVPPLVVVAAGLVAVAAVTVLVRWFIGQYVRRARPHAFGIDAGQTEWAARASRRILLAALGGALLAFAGGSIVGVGVLMDRGAQELIVALVRSPAGLVLLAGVGLILLAPVIGLLWSAWAEGPVPGH